MILTGRIEKVVPVMVDGKQKIVTLNWPTGQKTLYAWAVMIAIPFVTKNGMGLNSLVCDYLTEKQDVPFTALPQTPSGYTLTISAHAREYNGKLFNSIRLVSVSADLS